MNAIYDDDMVGCYDSHDGDLVKDSVEEIMQLINDILDGKTLLREAEPELYVILIDLLYSQ